jgi:hypothetical protein
MVQQSLTLALNYTGCLLIYETIHTAPTLGPSEYKARVPHSTTAFGDVLEDLLSFKLTSLSAFICLITAIDNTHVYTWILNIPIEKTI